MIAAELLVLYCVALSCLKPCRNVKNDLSGTIYSAGRYKVCRAAAVQPVSKDSKRSLRYMPLNFH